MIRACFYLCLRKALVFSACLLFALNAFSQAPQKRRIQIINSDTLRTVEIDSTIVRRLWGNVVLEHNGAIMKCDSAYLYPNDVFEAKGNTIVTSGQTTIKGDKMSYIDSTSTVHVRGRIVYLTDSSFVLRTNAVDFNTKDEIGYFENEGTIKDSVRILESKRGYYYAKRKEFEFIGRVQSETAEYKLQSDSVKYNTETNLFTFYANTHIWEKNGYLYCDKGWYNSQTDQLFFLNNSYVLSDKQEIFADSIYYENKVSKGKLYSNIQVIDTAERIMAMGDFADFNMKNQDFELTKNSSLLSYDDKGDTVYMRAERILSFTSPIPKSVTKITEGKPEQNITPETDNKENSLSLEPAKEIESDVKNAQPKDSTYREVFGIDKIKIFRNDFQAKCDSLYFNTIDSVWKMHKEPVLWDNDKIQISADSIKAIIINGTMNHAEFNNNSMIVIPEGNPDSTEYFNQVKGKNMKAFFENQELTLLDVVGNVKTLFFSLSDQAMNDTESASLKMFFRDKKMYRASYYRSIKGKNNPLLMVPLSEIKLPGFLWQPEARPKSKEEVLGRPLRMSVRKGKESLDKPKFEITKRINEIEQSIAIN